MLAVAACLLAAVAVSPASATAAGPAPTPAGDPVRLSTSRAEVSTGLGNDFSFDTTVTNTGRTALSGLVAHLNVVTYEHNVYVDPEDWSSHRTRYLDPLGPGRSVTIPWTVKAVNGGRFAIYVAVLPPAGDRSQPLTVGTPVDVRIAEHRLINPGGVLPLVIGIPIALALCTVAVRGRNRRLPPSAPSAA